MSGKDFVNQGLLLKRLREAHQVSQMNLSKSTGIHFQLISSIERGVCGVPPKYLVALSEFFKVEKNVFIKEMVRDYATKLESY